MFCKVTVFKHWPKEKWSRLASIMLLHKVSRHSKTMINKRICKGWNLGGTHLKTQFSGFFLYSWHISRMVCILYIFSHPKDNICTTKKKEICKWTLCKCSTEGYKKWKDLRMKSTQMFLRQEKAWPRTLGWILSGVWEQLKCVNHNPSN